MNKPYYPILLILFFSFNSAFILAQQNDCSIRPLNSCNFIINNTFTPSSGYTPTLWGDPFNHNPSLITDWKASHGTPNIYDGINYPNSLPFANSGYARMAAGFVIDDPTNEGIVQKISPVQAGNRYALSFFNKIDNYTPLYYNLDNFYIVLMQCSDFVYFDPNSYEIPQLPRNSQVIYRKRGFNNTIWEQEFICFVPNQNYDMIWIFPKQNDQNYNNGVGLISFPEIIDITNFTAGETPNPSPGSCTVTIGPSTPNCSVKNAQFTWHGPNNQIIAAPINQQIQVDASDNNNAGTWTLTMNIPGKTNNCPISASINVSSCTPCSSQSIPLISPSGPIDYYIPLDSGPEGVLLTSSFPNGNQWYFNGQAIPGATNQTLKIDWNLFYGSNIDGQYHTVVNGCPSNRVVFAQHMYGYGSLGEEYFNFGAKMHPVNSPNFYCLNTTGIIRNFDLGPNSDYSWIMRNSNTPNGQPNITLNTLTYNPASPVADIIIGGQPNVFTKITGIANNNGRQKIIDYLTWESPYAPPRVSGEWRTCSANTVNIYATYGGFYTTWEYKFPGTTLFDWEEYEFGPNTTLLNYINYVVSINPLIVRVPGRTIQNSPIQVKFSGISYIKKSFYYNNPSDGCAKENINVIAAYPNCLRLNNTNQTSDNIFPNPAKNQITISSEELMKEIAITSFTNYPIKVIKVNNLTSINISVADLSPGIYYCKIYTKNGFKVSKLLIRR